MAAVLHHDAQMKAVQCETPPHLRTCMTVDLYHDDCSVLSDDVHALSSSAYHAFSIMMRSQQKSNTVDVPSMPTKQVRFEEHRPSPSSTSPSLSPKPTRPTICPSGDDFLQFTTIKDHPPEEATAPHPVNTKEGWNASQCLKQTEWRNGATSDHSCDKSAYRFTSDIQSDLSYEDILK